MNAATQYFKQARKYRRRVFFRESTALVKGQAVCYDRDYGTAADHDERRDTYVENPSTTNQHWFAGVTMKAYAAKTGGQHIDIYEPGSVCEVACRIPTVAGETLMGFVVDTPASFEGMFYHPPVEPGIGAALALRTKAAKTDATCLLGQNLAGTASINSTTLTDAAATFTTATAVQAGDTVVITSHANENTVVAGVYTVASVTDATHLVLTAAASAGAAYCNYTIFRTSINPTVLAYLIPDGQQVGGVEEQWIKLTGAIGVAPMPFGATHYFGGVTLSADTTCTLAVPTLARTVGLKKRIRLLAALGTHDLLITMGAGTDCRMPDLATALATLEFDAANDDATLTAGVNTWHLSGVGAAAPAQA